MSFIIQRIAIAFATLVCGTAAFGRVKASDYFQAGPQRQLAEAGARGDLKTIDRLLASGADVNGVGNEKMTALVWTLIHQNKRGFEYLLQKGANPNIAMDKSTLTSDGLTDGASAVSLAARDVDPWYLKTALKYKGDPNSFNPIRQDTPIFECITLSDRRRPQEAQARIAEIKMLTDAGANLQAFNRYGVTPMIAAAWLIRYDLVYTMLEAGADPEAKSRNGMTLLNEIGRARIDPKSDLFGWRTKVIALLQRKGIDITDDMPRLEGRWQVVSLTEDGIQVRQVPTYYEFSHLELKVVSETRRLSETWSINLDLATRPREMEMFNAGSTGYVAYELSGDTLRLTSLAKGRAAARANTPRPLTVMVLRRVEPNK